MHDKFKLERNDKSKDEEENNFFKLNLYWKEMMKTEEEEIDLSEKISIKRGEKEDIKLSE